MSSGKTIGGEALTSTWPHQHVTRLRVPLLQVKEFNHKVKEFASSSGWEERERPGESLPNEDLLFRAPKQNAET